MVHNVIEENSPLTYTVDLKVYGNITNLSLAAAIYNWYIQNKMHLLRDGVDLGTITDLLNRQLDRDAIQELTMTMEGECEYAKQ